MFKFNLEEGLCITYDRISQEFDLWFDSELVMAMSIKEFRGYFGTPALKIWGLA